MADAGFIEGGSVIVLRAKHMQKIWGHATFAKTTPIFERFGEKLLVLLVNPFSIEIFAKAC